MWSTMQLGWGEQKGGAVGGTGCSKGGAWTPLMVSGRHGHLGSYITFRPLHKNQAGLGYAWSCQSRVLCHTVSNEGKPDMGHRDNCVARLCRVLSLA